MSKVQIYWMIQGDPEYSFFPAGTNDEIYISLVSRNGRLVVDEEDTGLAAPRFCVRGGGGS